MNYLDDNRRPACHRLAISSTLPPHKPKEWYKQERQTTVTLSVADRLLARINTLNLFLTQDTNAFCAAVLQKQSKTADFYASVLTVDRRERSYLEDVLRRFVLGQIDEEQASQLMNSVFQELGNFHEQ